MSKKIKIQRKAGIKEHKYKADTQNALCFILQLLKWPKILYDKLINETEFEIVICHQPFTLISLLFSRRIKKIPILYLFISPSHQEYLINNENKIWPVRNIHSMLRRTMENLCLKKAGKVMYLSQYMKQKAIKIHGVNKNCLVYNPAGVDLEHFKPIGDRTKIKEELLFPPDKFHLLTVRNLERRMGLENLLKAVYFLRKIKVCIHLVIGGEGPERHILQNLVDKFNLKNDVTMAGFIPDEKLPKYYCAADFFILPTRELEGFGLVTIESMACGTPVLGTPVGATTEILSDFDSRMLFKNATPEAIAEGIQTALTCCSLDIKRYNDLRIRCREYVQKKFSWQRHINQLKSTIYELVNKDEFKN
jgi:glycosyltransferase involved in cell wall biosynthesis